MVQVCVVRVSILAGLACLALPAPASGQQQQDRQPPAASLGDVPDSSTMALDTRPAPDPYKSLDDLDVKGLDVPYPKIADTILRDRFGIRDWLAERGIGIISFNTIAMQYDLAQTDKGYRGPQIYNGQRFTRTFNTVGINITYDAGRIGLQGGQFTLGLGYSGNSLHRVGGPNWTRVSRLTYFQPLFGGKIEAKVGLIDNGTEFLGTNTAGSLATGNLGPQAVIPYEIGMAYTGAATPGLNVKVNFDKHFYNKIGLQRSLAPGLQAAEKRINPSGFNLFPEGLGLLVIDELGWRRPPAAGVKSTWLRGGGIVNTTDFQRFDPLRGPARNNWALFAAADRQFTQIDPKQPFRGVYAGLTVNYAPQDRNFVTQYYEGRAYGIGLLKGRPFDLATLVATRTVYSPDGLAARTRPGAGRYSTTVTVVGSYAYRLSPGLYIQPGLGAVVHPIYSPRFGTALNAYLSITATL